MDDISKSPLSQASDPQLSTALVATDRMDHGACLAHRQHKPTVTIVIPARNEAASLRTLLPELRTRYPTFRLIVVDDSSTDDTCLVARENSADVISHPYRLGNGAAIKTGARACKADITVFMDGDGQHRPADIQQLLDQLGRGYDMAIGARDWKSQATFGRGIANGFYNRLASWVVGHRVSDLTSGFRAVGTNHFNEFLHLLPNGFSYPATITMAFFRAGYKVAYLPICAPKRRGRSHLRPLRDGLRFFLIIFRIGTLYSPLKLFLPISLSFLVLGVTHYSYSFLSQGRFTNMSALLMITSVLIFLIGLLSEQITSLLYFGLSRQREASPRTTEQTNDQTLDALGSHLYVPESLGEIARQRYAPSLSISESTERSSAKVIDNQRAGETE